MMADESDKALADAVTYGLSRVRKPGISLEPQQLEGVRHVYDGKDFFFVAPNRLQQVCLLRDLALCDGPQSRQAKHSRCKPTSLKMAI